MKNVNLEVNKMAENKLDQSNGILKEWLDTKEAAKFLSISDASLRNMVAQRKIIPGKLGRRNRYHIEDLLSLISFQGKRASHGN